MKSFWRPNPVSYIKKRSVSFIGDRIRAPKTWISIQLKTFPKKFNVVPSSRSVKILGARDLSQTNLLYRRQDSGTKKLCFHFRYHLRWSNWTSWYFLLEDLPKNVNVVPSSGFVIILGAQDLSPIYILVHRRQANRFGHQKTLILFQISFKLIQLDRKTYPKMSMLFFLPGLWKFSVPKTCVIYGERTSLLMWS